jgi:hypothetical protein
MNLKEELLKAYLNRMSDFERIHETFRDEDEGINGPLLMSPGEKYLQQPNPLFIIGQETNEWVRFTNVNQEEYEKLMLCYENFNVGSGGRYSRAPFWNVTRKIEATLGNERCSCAWTNISKYDQKCKRPDAEHVKVFSLVDNLLIDEIAITKPKICIFFTGRHFDWRIANIFPQVEFLPVSEFEPHVLSQLKHPSLPVLTFRTYHPRYLKTSGLENGFIEFIGKQVNNK